MRGLTKVGPVPVPRGTGLALRSLIPLIPFVGGSASVLVEARLSALQARRIDDLYEQLRLLTPKGGDEGEPPFSDETLERATRAAAASVEVHRPGILAHLLSQAEGDPSEQLRRTLIDICGVLSNYELAVILSLSGEANDDATRQALERLVALDVAAPEFEEIRSFAMHRLASYRLISAEDASAYVMPLGRRLVAATRDQLSNG